MSEHQPLRTELESRVLALINGELDAAEAAALEQLISRDPELATYREQMQALITDVESAHREISATDDEDAPRSLTPERRQAVLAAIREQQDESEDEAQPRRRLRFHNILAPKEWNWRRIILDAAAVALLLAILGALLIPSVGSVRKSASQVRVEMDLEAPSVVTVIDKQEFAFEPPPEPDNAPSLDLFATKPASSSPPPRPAPRPAQVVTGPAAPPPSPPAPGNQVVNGMADQEYRAANEAKDRQSNLGYLQSSDYSNYSAAGETNARAATATVDSLFSNDQTTASHQRTRELMLEEVSANWQRPQVYDLDVDRSDITRADALRSETEFLPISRQTILRLTGRQGETRTTTLADPFAAPATPSGPTANDEEEAFRNFFARAGVDFDETGASLAFDGTQLITTPTPLAEKSTAQEPFSTFSLNVSEVSFRLAESALRANTLPAPGEIRAEEFINAIPPDMPAGATSRDVHFDWEITEFPLAHNRQLVRFAVRADSTGRPPNQPSNLVLVVDTSGSMQRPDRQAILKESLRALSRELGAHDRLSAVVFARTARVVADGANGASADEVAGRVLAQTPEGGTNLELALQQGYALAQRHYQPHGINRVILLTDGAANLGEVDSDTLRQLVIANRQRGIALDAFGVGWDGYNDELLEALTRNSDGHYAFLNDPQRAAEDFAQKLVGALNLAAADVKVQVEWNPNRVISYRQIGYEKHQLQPEDFRDNTVDAAELTAAEAGQALYVVQLNPDAIGGLGTLRVRYRDPQTGHVEELAWPLEYPSSLTPLLQSTPSHRIAIAGALLADKLARTPNSASYSLADVEALVASLPPPTRHKEAIQRLRTMIHQARQVFSE